MDLEAIPVILFLVIFVPLAVVINIAKQQGKQGKQGQQGRNAPPAGPAAGAPAPRPQAPKPAEKAVLPPRPETQSRPALQPTLHDHSDIFAGSLLADDGTEGEAGREDMPSAHSDEELNQSLTEEQEEAAQGSGIVLDFSPKNIASVFVLQEVLRRK